MRAELRMSAEEATKDINTTLFKYGLGVYDWEDKGFGSKFYICYPDADRPDGTLVVRCLPSMLRRVIWAELDAWPEAPSEEYLRWAETTPLLRGDHIPYCPEDYHEVWGHDDQGLWAYVYLHRGGRCLRWSGTLKSCKDFMASYEGEDHLELK